MQVISGARARACELCWLEVVGRVVAPDEAAAHKREEKLGQSVRAGVVEPAGRSA